MKRTQKLTKRKALYIEELEKPAEGCWLNWPGKGNTVTTLAVGEESLFGHDAPTTIEE